MNLRGVLIDGYDEPSVFLDAFVADLPVPGEFLGHAVRIRRIVRHAEMFPVEDRVRPFVPDREIGGIGFCPRAVSGRS